MNVTMLTCEDVDKKRQERRKALQQELLQYIMSSDDSYHKIANDIDLNRTTLLRFVAQDKEIAQESRIKIRKFLDKVKGNVENE
jgi:hypothetical protein